MKYEIYFNYENEEEFAEFETDMIIMYNDILFPSDYGIVCCEDIDTIVIKRVICPTRNCIILFCKEEQ